MINYSAYPRRIRVFVESLSGEMGDLIDRVASRSLSVAAWQSESERAIAKHITSAFMAARGKTSLSQSEIDAIQTWVSRQMQYLNGFASEMQITEWEDWPAKWTRRAELYASAVVVPFYSGETWGIPLPAMPGDGSSQCGQADKCTWSIETLQGRGNWNATWTLHPAEHCQTCIERARLWNPLMIRNYQLLIPPAMSAKEITNTVHDFLRREKHVRSSTLQV